MSYFIFLSFLGHSGDVVIRHFSVGWVILHKQVYVLPSCVPESIVIWGQRRGKGGKIKARILTEKRRMVKQYKRPPSYIAPFTIL
jgi:hypothetical protein